nr:MAG: hypothetical protein [White spot syndrome virus]
MLVFGYIFWVQLCGGGGINIAHRRRACVILCVCLVLNITEMGNSKSRSSGIEIVHKNGAPKRSHKTLYLSNRTERHAQIQKQIEELHHKTNKQFEQAQKVLDKNEERKKHQQQQQIIIPLDPEERRAILAEIDKHMKEIDGFIEESERLGLLVDAEINNLEEKEVEEEHLLKQKED